ncbi:MAG: hypothetical protein RLZZ387_1729 [Chloroflexota bacterium]|jgi:hypothetical protein
MSLTTHHLYFQATAATPVELDEQAGSQVRGALVGALWERFCTNKAAPSCACCPLLTACPVATLVAPMREAGETGGEQRPRPYVVRPPAGQRYEPGEPLAFGLVLVGPAAQLFPYVVMAVHEVERQGIGRPLHANAGRRGRVSVDGIMAVNPLTGEELVLFRHGERQVRSPGLPIGTVEVTTHAAALSADRLTLRFRTPLRLIEQERLVRVFEPRPFVQRLAWRLDELGRAYGDGPLVHDRAVLAEAAAAVQVIDDCTRWVDVVSYSSRTRQRTPIGGLVGSVTLAGDLAPLRELLVWGSLVHVGKNAVKGDGWYEIGVIEHAHTVPADTLSHRASHV